MDSTQSVFKPADFQTERDIIALMVRAARLADECKFVDWMDLFAEDGSYGVITHENFTSDGLHLFRDMDKRAIQERVGFMLRLWQTPRGKTLHLVSNFEIEVDETGQFANVLSAYIMTRTGDAEQATLHACGQYRDELVRNGDGWLIKKRTVVVDSSLLPGEFTDLV